MSPLTRLSALVVHPGMLKRRPAAPQPQHREEIEEAPAVEEPRRRGRHEADELTFTLAYTFAEREPRHRMGPEPLAAAPNGLGLLDAAVLDSPIAEPATLAPVDPALEARPDDSTSAAPAPPPSDRPFAVPTFAEPAFATPASSDSSGPGLLDPDPLDSALFDADLRHADLLDADHLDADRPRRVFDIQVVDAERPA